MKLHDDYDELNKSKTFAIAATISIAAIVFIIACVLLLNSDLLKRKINNNTSRDSLLLSNSSASVIQNNTSVSEYVSDGLTVSDLDFYDLYKDKEVNEITEDTGNESESVSSVSETKEELDPSKDGKHTLITYSDETSEWVAISPYITKNNYNYENLINQNGKMKYFEDNKCVSFFGLDISKEQSYIDFNKLKKSGVDFVMIRVASRGYQSGQINDDDYFKDNLKRATDADIEAGVYFISSAVSEEEALEEASYVISMIGTNKLTYPVAFVMDYAKNDSSRIDSLTKNEKTMIARTFLNAIKEAGYKPLLYGTKEWLIKEVDLSKLVGDYDFWYSDTNNSIPDYPYKYEMWQYNTQGTIDGISGVVNFNISYVDYTMK